MSLTNEALQQIDDTRTYFDRTTRCLDEKDSNFRATPDTMTVAQQVAHAAQTLDWFREGAFDDHWDMDFETATAATTQVTSLDEARLWMSNAWERLRSRVAASNDVELGGSMADNPILGTRRRYHVVDAIVDHCGHHRGALAVYARLAGKVPAMPYMD
ncbi:MAG: DinB family protein [Thermoanaerobaculia bacterium]